MHFFEEEIFFRNSNFKLALSVGPKLKTESPLEREFSALSNERNLPATILNISEVIEGRYSSLCVTGKQPLALKGLTFNINQQRYLIFNDIFR